MYAKYTIPACLLIVLMLFAACEAPQRPEFKQIKNVKVQSLKQNKVTITADAEFHNPNVFGIKLTGIDLDVDIDGEKAGKVNNDQLTEVPAQKSFDVPLTFMFNPKELSGGAIGKAINIFMNKKMKVHFKGTVTVKALEMEFDIPVEDEREVPISKIF